MYIRNTIKQCLFKKYLKIKKMCIFHKGSKFDSTTNFEGCNLLGKEAELSRSNIGYASYLGESTVLDRVMIGKYTSIGPGVRNVAGTHPSHKFVSTHPAFFSLRKQCGFTYVKQQLFEEYKFVDENKQYYNSIGNDVWIGRGAVLFQGVNIGDGAIVGACALVTKDVPDYAIVAGIPAKIIGWRFGEEERKFLQTVKWWENDEQWINDYSKYFINIEEFIDILSDKKLGEMHDDKNNQYL